MVVELFCPAVPHGTVAAPPSKSMSHRAVLCAGLCRGSSEIVNLGYSRDIRATLDAVEQLCAKVERRKAGARIEGRGGFRTVTRAIDCGESGSTLRFLIPLFSQTRQRVHFVGHGRLMERPQSVYARLFAERGLSFAQDAGGITLFGALPAGDYTLPGNVSSQFVSGLLLMLPLLDRPSTLTVTPPFESASYVAMTLSVMRDFGVCVEAPAPNVFRVPAPQPYLPRCYTVEGDYSQAAFFAVLGAVCGGITLTGLCENSLQGDAVILDILQRCGAAFTRHGDTVSFSKSPLLSTEIDLADCPDLGPVLMVLGLFCRGTTVIRNAGRLRIKESDRIAAMEAEIRKCGGRISSDGDVIVITGGTLHTPEQDIDCHNDHRVVMSMSVLAMAAGLPIRLNGAEAVAKSWPEFFVAACDLGAEVHTNNG